MSIATASAQPASRAHPEDQEWPAQGQWTYEDYRRLPEDGWRYEVIEGELFMAPAPIPAHQLSTLRLASKFLRFGEEFDAGVPYHAPIDVILPGLASPVQPDILFIVKQRLDIVKHDRIEGAPDILVEVLSPSNWLVDRRKKFEIYAKAGVREYWIVDPAARTIELFGLHGSTYALIGKHGVGEKVCSEVLPGFAVKVEDICPAP
jgi:Uma2 family endonuclease